MKHIKVLAIIFFVFFLTGCNNQTLECSKSDELESGTATEKQLIVFENGKIDEYTTSFQFKVNEKYKAFSDSLFESLKSSFIEYKNADGIMYKEKKSNGDILITIKGDYSKMDNESKKSLGLTNNVSFDSALSSLENDGYSCKH